VRHAYKTKRMKLSSIILILFPCFAFSQINIKDKIDSLKYVSEIPYECEIIQIINNKFPTDTFIYNIGCGDKLFWDAVKLKDKAIPNLIEQLDNIKETPASFPFQGGQCKVADISYIVLQEIIHGIPTAQLLNVNPKDFDCGYCYYYLTLMDKENRVKFKLAVLNWYFENKDQLIWVRNDKYETCDCNGKHPNGGHFEIKK
jgi:hypothetical protein